MGCSHHPCHTLSDDDCFVAKNPSGEDIDVMAQHIKNLLSPATPYFFNTLYDPYREGADFVRGYPFSLREGVTTAISHGLWMNIPGERALSNLLSMMPWPKSGLAAIPFGFVCPSSPPFLVQTMTPPRRWSSPGRGTPATWTP